MGRIGFRGQSVAADAGLEQKMSVVSVVALAVSAIALTVGVLLIVRLLRGQIASPGRAWMVRSGQDRRRRKLPVLAERRRGLRRQDEIAGRFLSEIGKSTVTRPLAPR